MTQDQRQPFENVLFLEEARDDLRAVASRSHDVLIEIFRVLKALDAGLLAPTPLRDLGKTGDLSDCGKIVVAVPGHPEHRIVVRSIDGGFEVCEVVAVEDRTGDLPYLLAGIRLQRMDDPVRRSDALRRVHRIRKLLDG